MVARPCYLSGALFVGLPSEERVQVCWLSHLVTEVPGARGRASLVLAWCYKFTNQKVKSAVVQEACSLVP